jgi:1-deoxy-D-xylulose-5-phosphate reductoisomerase
MEKKRILLLGSTGSIGRQTLDVISRNPELFDVVGLAAGSNADTLREQALAMECQCLGLGLAPAAERLREELTEIGTSGGVEVFRGAAGLVEMVGACRPDLVVGAISGFSGLPSILAALEAGISVALANKEPLVAAGELVTRTAEKSGADIIPIDSELSAIFQCLKGERRADIKRIMLTASGGPFAELSAEELRSVTAEQALAHPTWRMGRKVTIDSATLANKGFEIFEMRWLFGVSFPQVEVVVHHQSIIHSLVEFCDTSILAQMGRPDMRVAIQYALTHPQRVVSSIETLDLAQSRPLTFAEPDVEKFPCLRLAREAGEAGGGYPVVLVGADEAAVELFLNGHIRFVDIPARIERALDAHDGTAPEGLDDIGELNDWAYRYVTELG